MEKGSRPEILAPAGGTESIYAAVRCGADGVYAGGRNFSARANAVNFSDEELKAAAEYCHLHGAKLYRAMNVILFDSEIEKFAGEVKYSAEIGIDGIIVQDMGAAAVIRAIVPEMPIHASTQLTVHTPKGALAAEKLGFCRVVPARELTLGEIEKICRTGIETEVFVHGAQCMCLSGQCYMSAAIGSRSANRGQCAQSCRLPFSAGKNSAGKISAGKNSSFKKAGENTALSLKDMSLLEHTAELISAGVDSFKIEGRMKRPEYVAAAVTAFKNAVHGSEDISGDMNRLQAVFSRSGFTDGYLTGKLGREMFGSRRKEDVSAADEVLPQLAELYRNERKSGVLDLEFIADNDRPALLKFTCGDICGSTFTGTITGGVPQTAINRSLTEDDIKKQLSKLGGTRYTLGDVKCSIGEGLTLPAAELNRMRREAVLLADKMTVEKNTPKYSVCGSAPEKLSADRINGGDIAFRLSSDSAETAAYFADRVQMIILPLSECEKINDENLIPKTAVSLPHIVSDEERLIKRLKALRERGFKHFYCENFTHLGALSELDGVILHGGSGMNISNSYAARECARLGFADIIASFELKAHQIAALRSDIPVGVLAYGRLPLMTVKNCPIKAQTGCKSCTGRIIDRTGREFPVDCGEGYARIYNSDILETSDKLSDFGGIAFAVLDIRGLEIQEIGEILSRYESREKPVGKFTRGLYTRGSNGKRRDNS